MCPVPRGTRCGGRKSEHEHTQSSHLMPRQFLLKAFRCDVNVAVVIGGVGFRLPNAAAARHSWAVDVSQTSIQPTQGSEGAPSPAHHARAASRPLSAHTRASRSLAAGARRAAKRRAPSV
ncbi:hypothetical protein FGB62_25g537 [Gracilaria domingensis]|nr:hypothetical protein FGB62_25g537 [Gracilaria domingensis]